MQLLESMCTSASCCTSSSTAVQTASCKKDLTSSPNTCMTLWTNKNSEATGFESKIAQALQLQCSSQRVLQDIQKQVSSRTYQSSSVPIIAGRFTRACQEQTLLLSDCHLICLIIGYCHISVQMDSSLFFQLYTNTDTIKYLTQRQAKDCKGVAARTSELDDKCQNCHRAEGATVKLQTPATLTVPFFALAVICSKRIHQQDLHKTLGIGRIHYVAVISLQSWRTNKLQEKKNNFQK